MFGFFFFLFFFFFQAEDGIRDLTETGVQTCALPIYYNLQMTAPTTHSNTWQTVTRVDYQASSKLRISAKYAGQNGTVQLNPGTMPGYNDTVFQFPAILVPSATVDYTINTTTIFEGTWGLTQGNQLGNVMADSVTNRNNVGLGNLP